MRAPHCLQSHGAEGAEVEVSPTRTTIPIKAVRGGGGEQQSGGERRPALLAFLLARWFLRNALIAVQVYARGLGRLFRTSAGRIASRSFVETRNAERASANGGE